MPHHRLVLALLLMCAARALADRPDFEKFFDKRDALQSRWTAQVPSS